MKQITIDAYLFGELTDKAKETARNWYRESNAGDNCFAQPVEEDLRAVAAFCGFNVDKVHWSGFSSQGDGASFTGTWSAAKVSVPGLLGYAPQDAELLRIVTGLETEAKRFPSAEFSLVSRDHRYSHAWTVCLEDSSLGDEADHLSGEDIAKIEDWLEELSRDLMNWFYKALEAAYEYENSDEGVTESIVANEYLFTAEGKRSVTLEKILQRLRSLDDKAAAIRSQLRIGRPGEELFSWEYGDIDEDLIVIADGYGGASLQRVEGDGDNRLVKDSRDYATEREALDIAGELMDEDLEFDEVFTPAVTP